jgi:opacity protein-like surface antigen
MKKVLFTAAALFAFGFANAQEEVETTDGGFAKGNIFMSGTVGFNSDKTGPSKMTGFEIEPRVGFFLTDNIAIGAKIGFESDKTSVLGVDTNDNSTLTAGAFARYYFTPGNEFSVFGEFGFDYMSMKDNMPAGLTSNGIGTGVGVGVNYFLSNNFAIEASWAGLRYMTNDNGGAVGVPSSDSFGLRVDMRSINFGLLYKF